MILKTLACSLLFVAVCMAQQDAILHIGPFDGGMVTTRSPYSLNTNELSDAKNCDFSTSGEIRCRLGYGTIGAIAGKVVLGAAGYANDGGTAIGNNMWVFTADGRGTADSLYLYILYDALYKMHVVRNNESFVGMPSFETFKRGALVVIPARSPVQKDSINTVRYAPTFPGTAINKIGLPSCSLMATTTKVDTGKAYVTDGTHLYAITFRRQYTLYGVTYYEEGNCKLLKSVTCATTADTANRVRLDSVPKLGVGWRTSYDGYNGLARKIVYRTLAGGSTLYKIGELNIDSTTYTDSLSDDSVNTYNPTYDEVQGNYCIDSLLSYFHIRGVALHDNRLYVLTEGTENFASARTQLYRTIPFTLQAPLLFNSSRKSAKIGGKSLFKTGMISCGNRLYTYGISGISVLSSPNDNLIEEQIISDLPIQGANCVECVDGNLWAMGNNGSLFSSAFGKMPNNKVALIDSTHLRYASTWQALDTTFFYKTYSFNAIRPFDNLIFTACNDSSKLKPYMGFANGNDIAWTRTDFKARSMAGDPVGNVVAWIDTSKSKLEYWPNHPFAQKDYNGTDSANIDLSFSTGWMDFGSFNDLKQIKKIVMNMSLVDTMKIYTYWDGSATATDTGTVWSQDTVRSRHVGDSYTWYLPRKNIGRYLKLTFRHQSCTERKLRFRNAKIYCDIARM